MRTALCGRARRATRVVFFFQAKDGIRDLTVTGFRRVLFRSALAQRLAAMPVRALARTREAMDSAQLLDYEHALTREARQQGQLGAAHDYQEGVAAFLGKRAAVFSDR